MARTQRSGDAGETRLRAIQCAPDTHVRPALNARAARESAVDLAKLELRAVARAGGGWLTAGSAAALLGHIDASDLLVAAHLERLRKNRTATAALRARRLAARVCIDCGEPVKPGGTRCELHARLNVERTLAGLPAHRARRVEQGLCVDCGEPIAEGKRRCARHLLKERERARSKRQAREVSR